MPAYGDSSQQPPFAGLTLSNESYRTSCRSPSARSDCYVLCRALPFVAASRLMADGVGFAGEGDLVGALVGLGDRLDTICGFFGVGLNPTGAADPYGLRRHALAIIRILRAQRIHLDLPEVVFQTLELLKGKISRTAERTVAADDDQEIALGRELRADDTVGPAGRLGGFPVEHGASTPLGEPVDEIVDDLARPRVGVLGDDPRAFHRCVRICHRKQKRKRT